LAGSFSILAYIFLSAGGALVEGRSPTAVLATLGLMGMRYRRRFRRMFGKPSGTGDSFDDDDFETPEKADDSNEVVSSKESGPRYLEPARAGVTSFDPPVAMMYAHRIPRARGTSSGTFRSFGGSEEIQTPRTVTVVDEPAVPEDPGRYEESAAVSNLAQAPVATNGDSVATWSRVGTGQEPMPAKTGRTSQTAVAPGGAERAVVPQSGDDSESPPDTTKRPPESLYIAHKDGFRAVQVVDGTATRPVSPVASNKKKSRYLRRLVRRTTWLALAVGAATALVWGHAELRVTGPFNVLPIENADARAAVDGVVDKIYVHEGDYVRQGEPIAGLTDIDTRAALEKTEAQLAEAYARLRMQQAGPTPQEIDVARAAVATLTEQLKYAQTRISRLNTLMEQGLLSKKDFEDAEDLAKATANNLAEAEAKLDALMNSVRPEQIDQTKAQIEQLEADQRHLGVQRRLLTVYSPSTGVVATPTLQLKQLMHQLVKKGDLIAKVYDLRTVTAQIAVDEKDIADVHVNQEVVLRARAYPEEVFHGTVNFVSTSVLGSGAGTSGSEPAPLSITSSSSSSAKRAILVTTQIDNHSLLLKPEMTGQAKILGGRRRALDLVTRRLTHTIKVEFWSWW